MSEPTITQIAKRIRDSWSRWLPLAQVGEMFPRSNGTQWVEDHIALCDAVIESEIRREEFEWLKEFERRVREVASDPSLEASEISESVLEDVDWLDQQRANREGPQS